MPALPLAVAVSDYKLTELLGSAGATIGVIISGTIFLQFISSKFGELSRRYSDLTGEYRKGAQGDRHSMLQAQIKTFRSRLILLNRASWLAAAALVSFLASVLAGGVSMTTPEAPLIRPAGTIALFLGLVLIGFAVALEFAECVLSRHEIGEEIADLDKDAKGGS